MKTGIMKDILVALFLVVMVAFFALPSLGVMDPFTARIQNTAQIKAINIGIFKDVNCTQNLASIDWGVLAPGSVTTFQSYMKNTGNEPVILSLGTEAWNPANASTFITLSWDYGGITIQPGSVLPVTFSLTVSVSITGIQSFTFTIDIIASG